MSFTYKPLWKLLIDRGMTKEDLRSAVKLSPSTMAKMGKEKYVSLEVLHRICVFFDCEPGDLIKYVPEE